MIKWFPFSKAIYIWFLWDEHREKCFHSIIHTAHFIAFFLFFMIKWSREFFFSSTAQNLIIEYVAPLFSVTFPWKKSIYFLFFGSLPKYFYILFLFINAIFSSQLSQTSQSYFLTLNIKMSHYTRIKPTNLIRHLLKLPALLLTSKRSA